MSDRYLEHCVAVLRRSKEEAEDGVSCVLSVPEVDCIIELLKEQEPVPPRKAKRYIEYSDTAVNFPDTYDCGNCGEELPDNAKYCPACGRPVKWE